MTEEELRNRTKAMALRIIRLAMALPKNSVSNVLSKQLVRSATSVAANYRAACKARSKSDFLARLGVVEEEADETQLWLELLCESNLIPEKRVEGLQKEVKEITAIIAASRKTTRRFLSQTSASTHCD